MILGGWGSMLPRKFFENSHGPTYCRPNGHFIAFRTICDANFVLLPLISPLSNILHLVRTFSIYARLKVCFALNAILIRFVVVRSFYRRARHDGIASMAWHRIASFFDYCTKFFSIFSGKKVVEISSAQLEPKRFCFLSVILLSTLRLFS